MDYPQRMMALITSHHQVGNEYISEFLDPKVREDP